MRLGRKESDAKNEDLRTQFAALGRKHGRVQPILPNPGVAYSFACRSCQALLSTLVLVCNRHGFEQLGVPSNRKSSLLPEDIAGHAVDVHRLCAATSCNPNGTAAAHASLLCGRDAAATQFHQLSCIPDQARRSCIAGCDTYNSVSEDRRKACHFCFGSRTARRDPQNSCVQRKYKQV